MPGPTCRTPVHPRWLAWRLLRDSTKGCNVPLPPLDEYQRKSLLIPAIFWIRNTPTETANQIIAELSSVFDAWKETVTNKDGKVRVTTRGGLLFPSSSELLSESGIPAHRCGGPDITNDIDLAFKLWLDHFRLFEDLLERHGFTRVFAIVAMYSAKSASPDSLLRVSGLLCEHLSCFAAITADIATEQMGKARAHGRMTQGLSDGRLISAQRRTQARIQRDSQLKTMASDYFRNHPAATVQDAANYLKGFREFKNLSVTTISTRIKGAKTAALQLLDTTIPPGR